MRMIKGIVSLPGSLSVNTGGYQSFTWQIRGTVARVIVW